MARVIDRNHTHQDILCIHAQFYGQYITSSGVLIDGNDSESALRHAEAGGETDIDPQTNKYQIHSGNVVAKVVAVAAEEEAGNYEDWLCKNERRMREKEQRIAMSRQKQSECEQKRREKFERILATMEREIPEERRNEINVQGRFDKMK
jgi:hypothetical protein